MRPADKAGVDPFALTCDPRCYVPRPASEASLAELERLVRAGPVVALSGPPGLGKTMILRVLETRVAASLCSLYLPYGALAFPELCRLALGLLGRRLPPGRDAEAALRAAARETAAAGRPLLLLLDDANAVPVATLRSLVALVRELDGALRLLAVPVDDERAARVLAALGRDVGHVRFTAPMSPEETARYVAARLAQAGAPPRAAATIEPGRVAWLARESGGVPRRLHQLAAWLLHPAGTPAPDATPCCAPSDSLELDSDAPEALVDSSEVSGYP